MQEKLTLKQFLDFRLVSIIAIFAVLHQFLSKIRMWYFSEIPIQYDFESIFQLIINFVTLFLITCSAFYIIRWLNTFLGWSSKNVFFRAIIEIVLFTLISSFWFLLINGTYLYLKMGVFFRIRDIIYLCSSGTVINFIIVPLVELSIALHANYQSKIEAKDLQLKNEQFKYEILKNQINPHFLFNSLSVLNSLISINHDRAKEFTHNFSNVLRHVLDYKNTDSISLKDEHTFLAQYIYLLKTRFKNGLHVELNFPKDLLNKQVLPMVIQLLIENAIKHNQISEANPIQVIINATSEGISVSNTLQLKSSVTSWGIGLENIESRYASLGKQIEVKKDSESFQVFIPYL